MKDRSLGLQVIILALALLNVAIHLAFYVNLEYHRDELLYFSLGLHPSFGYATVPPLIGWLAALMQGVFGYSLFAVKLFPALLSGVLVLLGAAIAGELGGGRYAKILTAVAMVFLPFGLRVFHLFQPVCIDLILWTAVLLYSLKYVNTSKDRYLYLLGLLIGLGLLNKYLMALLVLCLLLSFLFSPYREIFKRKALYGAAGIAFLLFLPNLLWQFQYDLPVIAHMKALQGSQLVHVDRIGFMMDQVFMTFSVFFLVVFGCILLLRARAYRYLFWTTLLVFGMLLYLQGKSYYTMGMFPMLIAAGAVVTERIVQRSWLRWGIALLLVVLILPGFPMGIPVYKEEKLVAYFQKLEEEYGLEIGRRFEDGTIHTLPQDYADQLGWEELTQITAEVYHRIPDKSKVVIFADNYGQAGAIAIIGKKYGLPEPVSFNESFFYWAPKQMEEVDHFIYINDELGADVREAFAEVRIMGRISNPNAREYGTTVYLCTSPKRPFNELWQAARKKITDPF